MKAKLILLAVAVVAAAGIFWGFNPANRHSVEAVKPVSAPAVQAVYATGTVEASLMIPISPKVAARLMVLNVDEGAHVKAGDVLAQLEDTDLQQAVVDAQAKLELAEKDLARAQKLAKSGAISKEGFDQSQAAYTSAQAALERAKAELSYLQLVAPQDGTIIRRDGEIGEMISIGTSVFWMNGGDKIRIETEVDEEDVGLVQPNQKVLISADAFPGQVFHGTVQSITPKGDPVARSYRVRVGIEGDTKLMIGMTAETNIITKEKDNALMVPVSAVKDGKAIRINNGKAEEISVKTDIKTPNMIEITEGAGEGDVIVKNYDSTLPEKGRISAKMIDWSPEKK